LEIPRSYYNQIIVPDPHSALDLAPDSASPDLAVCTFNNDVVSSDKLYHPAEKLSFTGHYHLFKRGFIENSSFA
jgi:hypothetical protein